MEKRVQCCPTCGSKMAKYRHTLSKGVVSALIKVYERNGTRVFFIKNQDSYLTYNQRCNFQKLRYWGLVEKVPNKENMEKCGKWKVTDYGEEFVRGERTARRHVLTYRGNAVEADGDSILVSSVVDGYKYRGEYARESESRDGAKQMQFMDAQC